MLGLIRSNLLKSIFNTVKRNIISKGSVIKTVVSPVMMNINNIVWIDMEMTGLDINKDHILEIACIITDSDLNIISEGPDVIIHQDDTILNTMNEWCVIQHKQSGLTDASRNSTISIGEAENIILSFIEKYTPKSKCALAGNSVYMDRMFLYKYMPRVNEHLHYRIIDVSSVKELCKRWCHDDIKNIPVKSFSHRALSDIKESITELKYYKENIFKTSI